MKQTYVHPSMRMAEIQFEGRFAASLEGTQIDDLHSFDDEWENEGAL